MTYIASNGELYDDEEIFDIIEKSIEEVQDEIEYDEIALSWEFRLKL
jgi:hypothetical protein